VVGAAAAEVAVDVTREITGSLIVDDCGAAVVVALVQPLWHPFAARQ
jgi:hypothetical protein